jgi:hypothetical protein
MEVEFNRYLDALFGEYVTIAGSTYRTSTVFKLVDPDSYAQEFACWMHDNLDA